MSIPNKSIPTGKPKQFRVCDNGNQTWSVEGTDNNKVWIDAEPGQKYDTQEAAEEAAEEWAKNRGGEFIGVV